VKCHLSLHRFPFFTFFFCCCCCCCFTYSTKRNSNGASRRFHFTYARVFASTFGYILRPHTNYFSNRLIGISFIKFQSRLSYPILSLHLHQLQSISGYMPINEYVD